MNQQLMNEQLINQQLINEQLIKPEFYHLPIELHHLIYEYLEYEEILDLKYVCRKFYYLINQIKIKELSFTFFPNNRTKYDLHIFRLYYIKTSLNLKLTLKKLSIERLDDNSRICLKEINQLKQLEKLDIFIAMYQDKKSNQLIDLPNLRKLKFGYNGQYQIKINTPKLKFLYGASTFKSQFITNWDLIKFKYTSSIKFLSKQIEFNCLKGEFKNLKILELENSKRILNSTKFKELLLNYPKLKSIKFNYLDRQFLNYYEQIYNTNRELLINLQIKYHGLNLNNLNSIIRIRNQDQLLIYNNRRELEFSNYDLLDDNLYYVRQFDYETLIKSPIGKNIPENFFIKYNNLKELRINLKIVNQENLNTFIRNCVKLESLLLVNSGLNQQFYDQLHSIATNLIKLELNEIDDLNLNFNFLKQLKIKILLTNLNINFNNSNLNLDRIINLKEIMFKKNDKLLKIERINSNRYNLKIYDGLFYYFSNLAIQINFTKLINWINHFDYVIETRSKKRRLN